MIKLKNFVIGAIALALFSSDFPGWQWHVIRLIGAVIIFDMTYTLSTLQEEKERSRDEQA